MDRRVSRAQERGGVAVSASSEFTTVPCTKAAAMYALAHASFHAVEEDRCLTHSFLGPFGADWDLLPALQLIEGAASVMWNLYGLAGHELEVCVKDPEHPRGERIYFFDVKMPREVSS